MFIPAIVLFFFFNDTATTEIYTLSLHDALPIYRQQCDVAGADAKALGGERVAELVQHHAGEQREHEPDAREGGRGAPPIDRSEEHTSELQSRLHLVCRLLLEKKKKLEHNENTYR